MSESKVEEYLENRFCPHCGCGRCRVSSRRPFDFLAELVGFHALRCSACDKRFYWWGNR